MTSIDKNRKPRRVTEWEPVSLQALDKACELADTGMPLEIRSRKKDRYAHPEMAVFRIYPIKLRKYYEHYGFSESLIKIWVQIWIKP